MMKKFLQQKIIEVCNEKINSKGASAGLSFYAFFANKNDNWITYGSSHMVEKTHKLDHFEKAAKIKKMVEDLKWF